MTFSWFRKLLALLKSIEEYHVFLMLVTLALLMFALAGWAFETVTASP